MSGPATVIVLAAGQGTRMKLGRPKVLAPLCGRPMIEWVLDAALGLDPERVLVVVGHGADEVREVAEATDPRVRCVLQEEQLGTGHAVQTCVPELGTGAGPVVLLYGDMPLLTTGSVDELVRDQAQSAGGLAMLTSRPADPRGFGRIVRDAAGDVRAIVEEKDASPEERAIPEVNLGVYVFPGDGLREALAKLTNDNAQGEYYITDVVGLFVAAGRKVVARVVGDEAEAIGVNTLAHLAEARTALQYRILERHMAAGVFVEDPVSTYIDHDVTIGTGTRVLPCTVIRGGVKIGAGCEVGPFTHLRTGTVLEDGAEVGNFTEAKQSLVGAGSKAKHLSYLGDARIGAGCNIGAGTIFANYDGKTKSPCTVEDGGFVGSGTILVAPSTVGRGATTGAGAVVTRGSHVPDGETWVGVPARPLARRAPAGDPQDSRGAP